MEPSEAGPALRVPELDLPEPLRRKLDAMRVDAPYHGLGFRKERLDPSLHQRLLAHFRSNVSRFRAEASIEEIGNADPRVIPSLVYEDKDFNTQFAADLQPLHETWAGLPLALSYCYGIRCYQRGTFLHNHVDRKPHLFSATICVDHALDAPWPLHIESVDGQVSQVDLEPGEFIFYEGTRLAHGRPYPLNGDFYAGVFVHYHPADGATQVGVR